ncbi:formin-like protein 14 [Leopardus geoffroyi]|uniref:formin-like protein 14 n=1 Tax=Leopardus geoffroyi TaxID=46844 RepID=UPI001E2656C0|nr:formin-like protein 14 [Leopardus geoffroyi]
MRGARSPRRLRADAGTAGERVPALQRRRPPPAPAPRRPAPGSRPAPSPPRPPPTSSTSGTAACLPLPDHRPLRARVPSPLTYLCTPLPPPRLGQARAGLELHKPTAGQDHRPPPPAAHASSPLSPAPWLAAAEAASGSRPGPPLLTPGVFHLHSLQRTGSSKCTHSRGRGPQVRAGRGGQMGPDVEHIPARPASPGALPQEG